jgi:hypothetical protein
MIHATPIRNQGRTMDIRMMAPIMEEVVPANMRRESKNTLVSPGNIPEGEKRPTAEHIINGIDV